MRRLPLLAFSCRCLVFVHVWFQLLRPASAGYPIVSALSQPKICPELTLFNGTPVQTRYFENDCLVATKKNIQRQVAHDLNLVIMLPGTGAIGDELTTSEPYVAIAMQQIEDSALLPGYRLNAYLADSRCSARDATAATIRAMSTGPPKHGMIGSACSAGCVAINDALQFFNIFQLSPICTSVELSDHTRHPFFTRMAPSYKDSVFATYALMRLWEWHRLGVLHDHRNIDLLGRDVLLGLLEADADKHDYDWTVLTVRQLTTAQEAATAMAEARARDARVIANVMYEDVGVHLLCEAYKQEMLPPHWTQVVVSGWWSTSFLELLESSTDCSKEHMLRAGYGWLATNAHGGAMVSTGIHGLAGVPIPDIEAEYNQECVKFFGTRLGCDHIFSPYTYDAVWHYAVLLHKYLIDEGHAYEDLNTLNSQEGLFNLSLEADFLGLTGRVRHFNGIDPAREDSHGSIGDRDGPTLIRQIRGSTGDALITVGHRLPDQGLVWYSDVVWSNEDPSKAVPCLGGLCNRSAGWVPADGMPQECPSHTIWLVATGCTPCSAGEYSDGTQCLPCSAGTTSNASGLVGCAACSPGRFSNLLGAESCTECTTGRFSAASGASACEPCDQGHYQGDLGSTACHACGGMLVTPLRGAEGIDQCMCPAGTYRPQSAELGICNICTEGIECPRGTDLNNQDALPIVQEGYYTDLTLSVFKCLDDGRRCRRGPLGASCASGRYGRVCLLCEDGKAPATDGTCKECQSWGDAAPLGILILCATSCLAMVYIIFDRTDVTKQSHKLLLFVMTLSLIVTMLQQIGSLATVSIAWPGPMRSIFNVLNIMAFDLDALKVNCVVQPRPLLSFSMRMLMFAACVLFITVVHVMFVCLKHNMQFKHRVPTLVSGLGTICLIFYVTIFIAVLIPLQCNRNPNGLWTLKQFPSVICWDGHEEHTWMLVVALIAAMVPVGFLARCWIVIMAIPVHIRAGSVHFLRSYAFLFFRYKPTAYWFSLCHLLRSLLIALTTIMPVAGLQVLLMQVVLLVHLAIVCSLRPWRVERANGMEAALTLAVLLMLCCAALIIEENDGHETMAWTFAVMICVSVVGAAGTAVHSVWLAAQERRRKRFDIFICHHKAAAGCMARYLNVELTANGKRAFIDTDDLRELDKLFDYVATQTQALAVLCSKLVLMRPWCMGEIVTATNWKVRIAKVLLPEYAEPSAEMIEDYDGIVGDDLALLVQCGIDLPFIRETLRSFSKLDGCAFRERMSPGGMHSLCGLLCEKHPNQNLVSYIPQAGNPFAEAVLVAEVHSMEVACTSFLLTSVLASHMQDADIMKMPLVLTEEVAFPASAKICLLLCTRDCLGQAYVLRRLAEAMERGIGGLPILGDESFTFPGSDFIQMRMDLLSIVHRDPEILGNFVLSFFQTIAAIFQPGSYGSTRIVLIAKAKEIAKRVSSRIEGSASGAGSYSMGFGSITRHARTNDGDASPVLVVPTRISSSPQLPTSRPVRWELPC